MGYSLRSKFMKCMKVKGMQRAVWSLMALGALTGCANDESIKGFVDRQVFGKFGITLFASPTVISMKEIHLDGGSLSGRQAIVEGTIVEVGPHGTFIVVADESARMMVVLTQMPTPVWFNEGHLKKQVRVLGTFESGRRGLPLLYARAIRWLQAPVTASIDKAV